MADIHTGCHPSWHVVELPPAHCFGPWSSPDVLQLQNPQRCWRWAFQGRSLGSVNVMGCGNQGRWGDVCTGLAHCTWRTGLPMYRVLPCLGIHLVTLAGSRIFETISYIRYIRLRYGVQYRIGSDTVCHLYCKSAWRRRLCVLHLESRTVL